MLQHQELNFNRQHLNHPNPASLINILNNSNNNKHFSNNNKHKHKLLQPQLQPNKQNVQLFFREREHPSQRIL